MRRVSRNATAAAALLVLATCGAALALPPSTTPSGPPGAAATPAPEVWPMPIEQFLAGDFLDRADVVLTRRDGDFASWLIRWATESPFSHAALIFSGPAYDAGYTSTFVIESGTSGVDLTNLRDYLSDKSSFMAIKRLKQSWFDEEKRARVRGLLLEKIKSTYNYWAIGRIVRSIWFGVERNVEEKERTIERYKERDWELPNEFICSGLVQLGFVETVLEYIKQGLLPPTALKEVVFHDEAASRLPDPGDWQYLDGDTTKSTAALFRVQNAYELESVTPQDLAVSDKLEWLYFIKDSKVYKVSSFEEVKKLLP